MTMPLTPPEADALHESVSRLPLPPEAVIGHRLDRFLTPERIPEEGP